MRLLQAIAQPWALSEPGWIHLTSVLSRYSQAPADLPGGSTSKRITYGADGVAVISVNGPLMHKADPVDKLFGFSDHRDIAADLDEANERASAIILAIDSPGGTVNGTPELAAKVAKIASQKPVVAFTDGMLTSAAYYIAAGASQIIATPSAVVGSIGVIMDRLDVSGMLEKAGIRVEQFTSGPLKAAMSSMTPITPAQRDALQGFIDESAETFKAHVAKHRGIKRSLMHGGIFNAPQAAKNGFVDRVVNGIDELTPKSLAGKRMTWAQQCDAIADPVERGRFRAAHRAEIEAEIYVR